MFDRTYYNVFLLIVYFSAVCTTQKGQGINQNAKRVGLHSV